MDPKAIRRVVKRWIARMRPPRRLKFTREGKYFIAVTFGVGFVAILTANNLLYVLLGILLSLIIVSGMLSEASLKDLRVTRKLPHRAQVGRAHLVEIEVHNDKKRMPSYAIEVEDLRKGRPADKRCFFLKISPGASQVAAYRRIPARRGLDQHVGFRVATRFPFGFFEKSREFTLPGSLIIYPAVDPVELPVLDGRAVAHFGGAVRRGAGDEIMGLRMMREGDDPRDIYWKRSATSLGQVVMERALDFLSDAHLKLDNLMLEEKPSADEIAHFEQRVRETASFAVAHLRRGEQVYLKTSSGACVSASPAGGADATLKFLALVDLERQGVLGVPSVHLAEELEAPLPPGVDRGEGSSAGLAIGTVALSQIAVDPSKAPRTKEQQR